VSERNVFPAAWRSALSAALLCLAVAPSHAGLLEYARAKDPAFEWHRIEKRSMAGGVTAHELSLVSQRWRTIPWRHRLTVLVPDEAERSGVALLLIGGSGRPPVEFVARISRATGCIAATLNDVPVQPLFGGLREDALIAFTFEQYLRTHDETWPLLLPMTRSAVAAMDAIQEFCRGQLDREVSGFVVAGASKRGWTTWLCAAADPRIRGIAPAVYDNLDLPRQMRHQLEAWGRFSEMIGDYTKKGLPRIAAKGGAPDLVRLVDPYAYRDRIAIPKLILIGTNDRYWPVDALNLYYDDLEGETYILYVPNAGHDLGGDPRVAAGLAAFLLRVAGRLRFPRLEWHGERDEESFTLTLRSDIRPQRVLAWIARSESRDFRDATWRSADLQPQQGGYRYAAKRPERDYAAVFCEAVYELDGRPLHLSTTMTVLSPGRPGK